jgi:hypothetical protein
MNIWLACLLSTQRFLVTNPLCVNDVTWIKDTTRVRKLRSQEDMANHLGTAVFGRILLWGYSLYITRDTRYVPMEYQKSMDNGRQKQEGIIALTNDRALPNIKNIQQMLKISITRLNVPMFTLFQSILVDFWALQPFVEPYRYEERLSQRLPRNSGITTDDAKSDKKEESAYRKQITLDMKSFRAKHQQQQGTPTDSSKSNSSSYRSVNKDNNIQISSSSASSSSSSSAPSTSSSSSSLSNVHKSIDMISPSAISTPLDAQTKTSNQKNDDAKMAEAAENESKKRKLESTNATSSVANKAQSTNTRRSNKLNSQNL